MAFSSTTIWEVRPTGNDANGSGFDSASAGTDYSQQDSAQLTITDGASVGPGTTLTSVTGGFTAAMVGNGIGIVHSAVFQGHWQITAFTDTNTVTVDRNLPATSAMTCRVGGASKVAANGFLFQSRLVGGNKVWVKGPGADAGDYLLAGNQINLTVEGTNTAPITVEGYTTTRGDGGRPTLKWSSGSIDVLLVSSDHHIVKNLTLDGAGALRTLEVTGVNNYFENIVAKNGTPFVITGGGNVFKRCRFTSGDSSAHGATVGAQHCVFRECVFDSNTGSGVDVNDITHFQACLFHGNTLDGVSYADVGDDFGFTLQDCILWNNSRDGVRISSTAGDGAIQGILIHRCIFGKHASGYDINYTVGDISANPGPIEWAAALLDCNAFYTTGSGKMNNLPANSGDTTLTGSPFTSDTDFTLNSTAGAGAAVRAAPCSSEFADDVNEGSYALGALGVPAASTAIASARSRWRELTNESSTTAVSDSVIDSYIQPALESVNRRLQYHYTTSSSIVTFVESQQEYDLPLDCVEVVFVELGGKLLQKRDMEDWQRKGEDWRNEENGTPVEWAHYSNKLIVRAAPSGACVAATPNPTIRYVSRPGDFTTNGMAQLSEEHQDIPVLLAAGEYLMTPSSAMDLSYGKVLLDRFEQEAQLAAKAYTARRVAR